MRLSLAINDRHIVRASLENEGWLSAHVNLSSGVDAEPPNRVWLVAYDRSEEPNGTTSTWDGLPIAVGDKIEIQVLPDGDSDVPTSIMRTADRANNLFSHVDGARSLLAAVKVCNTELMKVLDVAKGMESAEEFKKIAHAVGGIIVELDRQLISPTLRRHPQLFPEAQEDGLR